MSLPENIWQLRYEVPMLDEDGDSVEDEWHECQTRYYVSKSGLDKKVCKMTYGRVIAVTEGTISWPTPSTSETTEEEG